MKLIIVDDDLLIREDIKHYFLWESQGFTIEYEASNGKEAAKWLLTNDTDIILTDISMPNGDGIELIRTVKQNGFQGEIIVMSNYDDFDYVKDAMKLGAFDYCLKYKMSPESLLALLKSASQSILARKQADRFMPTEYRPEAELRRIALGRVEAQACERAINCGIIEASYNFTLVVSEKIKEIENSLAEGKFSTTVFIETGEKELLIAVSPDMYSENKIGTIVEKMSEQIIKHDPCAYVIENEAFVPTILLSKCYKEMQVSKLLTFYSGNHCVKSDAKCRLEKLIPQEKRYEFTEKIFEAATKLDQPAFVNACERAISFFSVNRIHPKSVYTFFDDVIFQISQKFEYCEGHLNQPWEEIRDVFQLRTVLSEWQQSFFLLPVSSMKPEIITVIHYLHANYMKDISLEDAANVAIMSKNHFCTLFRRETGESFVTYLQRLRIEKAKVLLKDYKNQVQDVSRMIGIDNYRYFSSLFRKYVGISPTQYREKIQ